MLLWRLRGQIELTRPQSNSEILFRLASYPVEISSTARISSPAIPVTAYGADSVIQTKCKIIQTPEKCKIPNKNQMDVVEVGVRVLSRSAPTEYTSYKLVYFHIHKGY